MSLNLGIGFIHQKTSNINHSFNESNQIKFSDEENDVEGTKLVNDGPGEYHTNVKPCKTRKVPIIHSDYDILLDNKINDEGELIIFTLLANIETINYDGEMKIEVCMKTLIEELK